MDKTIKVVIADDHMIVRDGLRSLLERQPDMEAVAEADNGRIALKLVKELSPGAKMLAKA
jgi:YesN/AraC family two-component response regulator